MNIKAQIIQMKLMKNIKLLFQMIVLTIMRNIEFYKNQKNIMIIEI